jgi:hypothetical protein
LEKNMIVYKETEEGSLLLDGKNIPALVDNRDYAEYLSLVDAGEATLIPWEGSEEQEEAEAARERQRILDEFDAASKGLVVAVGSYVFSASPAELVRLSGLAISSSDDSEEIDWVLSDDTVCTVTIANIKSALAIGVRAQNRLVVDSYNQED